MRGLIFILISVIFGCNTPSKDRIVVPELHAGFYSDALKRINKELESTPDDEKLVDQKLFYCEQLEWPTTCISALDAYRESNGMTNQLVEQYISYYKKHERYQLLLNVIERWSEEYDLENRHIETYIDCLTQLGKNASAKIALQKYLIGNQSVEALSFASNQYLRINDTTMAAYNLAKLNKLEKGNDLMWDYGKILISLGYSELGFDVMSDFVNERKEDFSTQLTYADLLIVANRTKKAKEVLKPFISRDTVSYLLADLYIKDQMWDSASLILENVIAKDSSERKPIWKLARLYEDRGWYLTSIPYLEYLLDLNPEDTLAEQRIDLIQRKIAYLQRLKFEENKTPTIELQPKKIEN